MTRRTGRYLALAAIASIMGTLSSGCEPQALNRAPRPTEPEEEVTGILEVDYYDDFTGKRSEIQYRLRDSETGQVLKLKVPEGDSLPDALRNGAVVRVRGQRIGKNELALQKPRLESDTSSITLLQAPSQALVSGERRVLAIIVNFQDSQVSCTPEQIRSTLFAESNSVTALYKEMSHDQMEISGDVIGPLQIAGQKAGACDPFGWASKAGITSECITPLRRLPNTATFRTSWESTV